MSVTSLLKNPEVSSQLDRIAPVAPASITGSICALPVTTSYALVGTAFDYALRFELQRRNPHVRVKPWVAEASLDRLLDEDDRHLVLAQRIVKAAKKEVVSYTQSACPTLKERAAIAAHAIKLARIDAIHRAGFVDPKMDIAEPGDVEDLLRLLDIVPYDKLADPRTMWLNPTFGRYSNLVGGADCDLVIGDQLIDIKVTKNAAIQRDYLRQIVSYALLARGARADEPKWPEIRHVGIYFARHGYLWTVPTGAIYKHPTYREVESWYIDHAGREFGTALEYLAQRKPHTALRSVESSTNIKVKATRGCFESRDQVREEGRHGAPKEEGAVISRGAHNKGLQPSAARATVASDSQQIGVQIGVREHF